MRGRTLLLPLALIVTLAHAEGPPGAKAGAKEADPWIGKTKEEIESLLGPATETKRKKDDSLLVYRFHGKLPGAFRGMVLDPGSSAANGATGSEWRQSRGSDVDATQMVPRGVDPIVPLLGDTAGLNAGGIRRIRFRLGPDGRVVDYELKTRKRSREFKDSN
jgi:hypothetical protein